MTAKPDALQSLASNASAANGTEKSPTSNFTRSQTIARLSSGEDTDELIPLPKFDRAISARAHFKKKQTSHSTLCSCYYDCYFNLSDVTSTLIICDSQLTAVEFLLF
jgi:hypothetical protein